MEQILREEDCRKTANMFRGINNKIVSLLGAKCTLLLSKICGCEIDLKNNLRTGIVKDTLTQIKVDLRALRGWHFRFTVTYFKYS